MTNDNISSWGLLGPEQVQSVRRARTLEVGSAVRIFNDLSVPGMGGVWFGKQLMLSLMGVAVAGRLDGRSRMRNIEMANTVEALACCLAFKSNQWQSDARLRGRRKMSGTKELLFRAMRNPSFYVTQPMRMATIQPLRALGLVDADGERFNAFRITPAGEDFLRIACGRAPVVERLVAWVQAQKSWNGSSALAAVLSPLESLNPQAREYLHALLAHSGAGCDRRAAGIAWVKGQAGGDAIVNWEIKPSMITEGHWKDMHAGALFFLARDAALNTLDALETYMGNTVAQVELQNPLPDVLGSKVSNLRNAANAYLGMAHDPSNGIAKALCDELSNNDDAAVLRALVMRDGRVLRLEQEVVLPASAYRGAFTDRSAIQDALQSEDEPPPPTAGRWPPGASRRLANLYLMNLDLYGTLMPNAEEIA